LQGYLWDERPCSFSLRFRFLTNGNMISGAGRTLTYDQENRPVSIDYAGNITDPTGHHVDAAGTVVQVIPDEFGTNHVVVIAGSEPPLLGKHILLKGQMEGGMIIAT
jgi:hypothetical protein